MPANFVRPGTEKYWQRAKAQAAKQGHENDWPYITAIYKQMTLNKADADEGLEKAVIPAAGGPRYFINVRQGGQVPSRERLKLMAEASRPARPMTTARLLDSNKPMLRLAAIFEGLGLDPDAQASWQAMLGPVIEGAGDELSMRQAIYSVLRTQQADGALGSALLERALRYRRDRLQKSRTVELVTVDDLLQKAGPYVGPRGGKWADPQHTIPWGSEEHHKQRVQAEDVAAGEQLDAMDQRAAEALASVAKQAGWSKTGKRSFVSGDSRVSVINRGGRWYVETGPRVDPSESPRGVYSGTVARVIQGATGERAHRRFALAARTAGRFMNQNRGESLAKSEARGGAYHRRVMGKGGRYRYYYDPEKYERSKDAHLDGEGAAKRAIKGKVAAMLEKAGKSGVTLQDCRGLCKRYGHKMVGGVLNEARDAGELTFKKGRLRAQAHKQKDASV